MMIGEGIRFFSAFSAPLRTQRFFLLV